MRLALQTVVCWCVLITVLPLALGGRGGATTADFNSTLKKRFRLWLQNRMRRDVRSGSGAASSEEGGGPEISSAGTEQRQQGNTEAFDFLSSFGPNRSKRSGCILATCAVHDLYHRLHQLTDKLKQPNAPEQKIKPNGYGRRRRRSAPELQYARSAALLHDGRQEPCCSRHGVEHGEHAALPSLD